MVQNGQIRSKMALNGLKLHFFEKKNLDKNGQNRSKTDKNGQKMDKNGKFWLNMTKNEQISKKNIFTFLTYHQGSPLDVELKK